MQKLATWLGMLALVTTLSAQDFTKTMTAEERQATGLEKLNDAELARLKAIVERYKAGEVAAVQQAAEEKVAAAEIRVQAAETKAAAADAPERKGPGWFTALLTLQKAGSAKESSEELQLKLAGTLRSFSGKRSFALENGQVWTMIEVDSYAGPVLQNPTVHIAPGPFGVFWLRIPEAALRVKVKPVKLE
jgi:hypothetical protein